MRMQRSKRLGLLSLVGAVALTLTACAGGGAAPAPTATEDVAQEIQEGGVVKIAAFSEFPGFDPVKLQNVGSGIERAANVFDTLMYRDEATDEVSPLLAKGMSTEDGITWVMELREGVEFTDGTPLNAEAVIFNLERHMAEDSTSPAKAQLSGIDKMEATSEYEVTFTLSAPNGSFPIVFTASSPASLIGSPTALADPEKFNENPVGAGPFVMKEWVRDATLTFVKNEDYWQEGLPYLDGLEYTVMTDGQTRMDSLVSGGLDLVLLNAAQWGQTVGKEGIDLFPVQTGGAAIIPNGAKAPTDDKRIREAMFRAFDPEVTNAVLFGGTDYLTLDNFTCVPFAPGSPACAPDAVYEYDLEKAKELVADYVADGGDPTVEIVYFQTLTEQATYIQQQFAAIGITAELRSVDIAGLSEAQSTGDYGVFWGSTASAGFPTVWTRYYSGGTNWGMVTYPELDEALMKARNELTIEKRNDAWREVAEIIHENAMLQWILPYSAAQAKTDKLHLGLPDHPYEGSTMVYFNAAWLEQ